MATIIKRTVSSIPTRTASESWEMIATLLAPDPNSLGRTELNKVAGAACSTIASEATKDDAITVWGSGPQIRIYCVFGDDAIAKDNINEESFQQCPTDGDWKMSIPCLEEDLEWTQKKLKSCSTRVTARSVGESIGSEKQAKGVFTDNAIEINAAEFLKS